MTKTPTDRPLGERFTHVYIEPGKPVEDSIRVRRRIAALIDSIGYLGHLPTVLPRELGIDVLLTGYGANWSETIRRLDLGDLLDLMTVAYREIVRRNQEIGSDSGQQRRWLNEVRRIFEEENFAYTVNDIGGVHYRLDEEFVRNRAATIATLQAARYANVLDGFTGGMAALSCAPPDGKGAIRATFAALEGLFRLIVPNASRLGEAELELLTPILNRVCAADVTALRSSAKMLNSLKDWVDSAHFYRHEQGVQEVAQPPLSLAVYLVSSGAAHLRWLAELDAKTQPVA